MMSKEIEKNESIGDELDLAQLKDQIRQEAEQRKRDSFRNGTESFYKQVITQSFATPDYQNESHVLPLIVQPGLERREEYQLNDLLAFHDEAFVRNAYESVLKREPDDSGFSHYLQNLRSGRYSKVDILSSLRFSPEGQRSNVPIHGLRKLSVLRKLYRLPIAGYLLRLVVAIIRLPVLITNYRQLESHTMAQLERVANHFNDAVAQLSRESNEQSKANQKQFDELNAVLRVHIKSLAREQEKLVQNLKSVRQTQSTVQAQLFSRLDEAIRRWQEQVELQANPAAQLQALKGHVDKQINDLIERLQKLRMDLAQQEAQLSQVLDKRSSSWTSPVVSEPVHLATREPDHRMDSLYFSLEDELRGTPEQIKEGVKIYLDVLERAGINNGILDVGCGRGEWLQVLREAGFQARGIDQNRLMIQRCKELSLDVIESEAFAYLRSLTDGALNLVTAFHFAEHLPLETLVAFLDEAGRILKPGGLIILETPNPENLVVGSCNFYLDPTHKNPIPIPTMKLLLEARGFRCQEVLKLHAVSSPKIEVKDQLTSHVNHFIYGPMNYAVVAHKPIIDLPNGTK